MRRLPVALMLLLLAPAVAAQVYTWTDAGGTVHYSETPPPQGTSFKRITTTGRVEPLAPAAREPVAEPRSEGDVAAQEPMADTPENRAKLCSSLKANLDLLRGSGPVVMEQSGKPVALDKDQRNRQIASAEQQYGQYCGQ